MSNSMFLSKAKTRGPYGSSSGGNGASTSVLGGSDVDVDLDPHSLEGSDFSVGGDEDGDDDGSLDGSLGSLSLDGSPSPSKDMSKVSKSKVLAAASSSSSSKVKSNSNLEGGSLPSLSLPRHIYSQGRREKMYHDLAGSGHSAARSATGTGTTSRQRRKSPPAYAWGDGGGAIATLRECIHQDRDRDRNNDGMGEYHIDDDVFHTPQPRQGQSHSRHSKSSHEKDRKGSTGKSKNSSVSKSMHGSEGGGSGYRTSVGGSAFSSPSHYDNYNDHDYDYDISPARIDATPSHSNSPGIGVGALSLSALQSSFTSQQSSHSPSMGAGAGLPRTPLSLSLSQQSLSTSMSTPGASPERTTASSIIGKSLSSKANGNSNGTGTAGAASMPGGLFFAFPSPIAPIGLCSNTGSPSPDKKQNNNHSNGYGNNDGSIGTDTGIGIGIGNHAGLFDKMNTYRKDHTKATNEVMSKKLADIHMKLVYANKQGTSARMTLLASADSMVSQLPLKYLFNKPELKQYAYERAMRPIIGLAQKKIYEAMKRFFYKWQVPPALRKLDETQVGFLVIATFLSKMLTPIYTKYFTHWMKLYSTRYHKDEDIRKNMASSQIADWYRHCRITKRKLFKFFTDAVKVCLDRRKAIKHTINFEQTRRSSLLKFIRAISKKRRKYYAARSIIRPYLWFHLYRKVQQRLTRITNLRILQRWFRMTRYRHEKEKYLINKILWFGGYSVVYPKVPADLVRRNGFLNGFDACASRLQRAWFVSKGNFAAFMIAAAKRAKEEYMQMRNDNALIIQSNFRGHLWNLLMLSAKQWNRSRRISFAFRHYQYRCWMYPRRLNSLHRRARVIQKWAKRISCMKLLHERFILRKIMKVWMNLKRTMAAAYIQGAYRAHLERERIKLEEFRKWVAEQRANAARVAKMIVKIQMVWRKLLKSGNRFPRHVYLIMWRLMRARRKKEFLAALKIQKIAKPFCAMLKQIDIDERLKAANTIWFIAKNYLMKLALWDRVEATKLIKNTASTKLKRNLRIFQWCRHIKLRGLLRRHQKSYLKLRYDGATYIQRWFLRKWAEYYIPVRSAARFEVKKKRMREEARYAQQRIDKAAMFILRFFRMFRPYLFNQKIVVRERARIRRIHAARTMQAFARKIVAWARFDKVVAYRKKKASMHPVVVRQRFAANVIGTYWKRKGEKMELQTRFVHRKFVLSEYRRLEALKIVAYQERDLAIEDKRRTDENMRATINASWKQGSDVSGKNYYYNYVTGESSWDPPDGWKVPKAINKWLRQIDDRQNVYYYNMATQESSWLAPCHDCGDGSEKYCADCGTAFCDRCFDRVHRLEETDDPEDEEQQELKLHKWSLTEYEKDILKPGEIYCIECKRRTAEKMCLQCWDAYCQVCFRYTHHTGNLKYHKTMSYKKVKSGWMCIKATSAGDADYYMNGATGVTSYEKPYELMTEDERKLLGDFLAHQKASISHVKHIEELQLQLEEASYERDSILQDAMNAGFMGGSVTLALKKKKSKKQQMEEDMEASNIDAIAEVGKNIKPGVMDWLFGSKVEYKQKLLAPKDRERNAQKSDYMAKLIGDISRDAKLAKEQARKDGMG